MAELKNIITTAKEKKQFQTLLKAAEILGLNEKYSTTGPYTVFAPIETAFEPIPEEVIEEAFDDVVYLMDIINYHIVEGKYMVKDLQKVDFLTTIGGRNLKIKNNNGITIDSGYIIEADIECKNGVIHAINEILIP